MQRHKSDIRSHVRAFANIGFVLCVLGFGAYLFNIWDRSSRNDGISPTTLERTWEPSGGVYVIQSAGLKIVSQDFLTAETTVVLDLFGPGKLPDGFKSVRYQAIFYSYHSGFASAEYSFGDFDTGVWAKGLVPDATEHLSTYADEDLFPRKDLSSGSGIINDYEIQIPTKVIGYYPFEKHIMDASFYILVELIKENGAIEKRVYPLTFTKIQNWIQDYSYSFQDGSDYIGRGFDNLTGPEPEAYRIQLEFRQPLLKRISVAFILIFFIFLLFLLPYIKDIGTLLGTVTAIFIGIWSFNSIFTPPDIPYQYLYATNLAIYLYFVLLFLAILVWVLTNIVLAKSADEPGEEDQENSTSPKKNIFKVFPINVFHSSTRNKRRNRHNQPPKSPSEKNPS